MSQNFLDTQYMQLWFSGLSFPFPADFFLMGEIFYKIFLVFNYKLWMGRIVSGGELERLYFKSKLEFVQWDQR